MCASMVSWRARRPSRVSYKASAAQRGSPRAVRRACQRASSATAMAHHWSSPAHGVNAVRRHVGGAVAVACSDAAVDVEVEELGSEEVKAHLQLGGIDVLAFAGSASMVESSHDGRDEEARSDGVRVGDPWTVGRTVGPAGDLVEAGDGAGVEAVAGIAGGGTGLAHETSAHHEDGGVELMGDWIAEAKVVDGAGREALEVHVGPGDSDVWRRRARRDS